MSSKNISADYIATLSAIDPHLKGFIARATTTTYIEFLSVLHDDIKDAVGVIEKQKQYITTESEDGTTGRLSLVLHGKGYLCGQVNSGGNVDLEVSRTGFRWIAEAKKFTSTAALTEGYLQLSTRYSTGAGSDGTCYGGMLAYLRRPDAVGNMIRWKKSLKDHATAAPNCVFSDCTRMGPLAFISEHVHSSYGTPFKVWHVCFVLHHEPQDKSARASKRKKAADATSRSPKSKSLKLTKKP